MSGPRPPRVAEWLITLLVPWRYRDDHVGDLREGFARRAADPRGARRWYRRQVVRSIPAALRLRIQVRNDDRTGGGGSMESLAQDLRFGLRSLVKSPAFAVVSTLTLALAIGVNTAIFSLVSVILFADLPMQDSETVALVRGVNPELGIDQGSVSPADYLDLVERARGFESMGALTDAQWVLTGGDQPIRVSGLQITAGMLDVWRLPPILGRSFADGEDRSGAPRVAMLTHGFWQEYFDGRTDVVGESLRLDGVEHTIVGVTDPKLEFASFRTAQVVTPLILDRSDPDRASRHLFVSGRLAPGITHEMATEEAGAIGEALADEHPAVNAGWALWAAPVMESLIDDSGDTILLLLQLTVGMVILIACANVANMLLARSTARSREMGVRTALGAGRGRLVRQLLTESLVISLAAGALGVALAYALNEAMIWISAGTEVVFLMAELDGRVLGFTLLVALLCPIVFGLFPALRASSDGGTLREGRSPDGDRAGKRARGALVTAQVALALALMVVAGLLSRSVIALQTRPLGFDATGIVTAEVGLPEARYEDPAARIRFFDQAREAVAAVPGLEGATLTSVIPGADFGSLRAVAVEGVDHPAGRALPTATFITVSEGYFEMIGLPLVAGRGLVESDGPDAPPVAVVSREVAGRFWPDAQPLGRRFQIAGAGPWIEVVGVVSDVRASRELDDPDASSPNVYLPHRQDARGTMYLVSRASVAADALAGPLREAIWSVDPEQPVEGIRTMVRAQYETRASSFAIVTLFVVFALFALVMAAVGIYGVMAYSVSQRSAEIGLRMALGAEAGEVRRMVLGQGARLLAAGLAIGLVAAFLLSRLLGNVVFGISSTDPVTFVGVPLALAAVALLANLVPALRATRMDPASTLRSE